MLKRLKVDNFKCLDGFEIEFGRHALLMGLNGSGKSTVVDVLDRLAGLATWGVKARSCFPPSTRTQWRNVTTQAIELELEEEYYSLKYRVVLGQTESGAVVVEEEELAATGCSIQRRRGSKTIVDNGAGATATGQVLVPDELSALPLLATGEGEVSALTVAWAKISRIHPYRFAPQSMDAMATAGPTELDRSTRNFASWLHAQPGEARSAIASRASRALPALSGFGFVPEGEQFRLVTEWSHPAGPRSFSFDSLSDGQRLVITLAALAEQHQDGVQTTLILDEPDNYVALPEIQPLLLSLMDTPEVQLIVVSHHPEVINLMAKDYGLVFTRENDVGPVRVKRWQAPADSLLTPAELVARGDIDGGA